MFKTLSVAMFVAMFAIPVSADTYKVHGVWNGYDNQVKKVKPAKKYTKVDVTYLGTTHSK